jgi:hypothetical protein
MNQSRKTTSPSAKAQTKMAKIRICFSALVLLLLLPIFSFLKNQLSVSGHENLPPTPQLHSVAANHSRPTAKPPAARTKHRRNGRPTKKKSGISMPLNSMTTGLVLIQFASSGFFDAQSLDENQCQPAQAEEGGGGRFRSRHDFSLHCETTRVRSGLL